MWFFAYFKLDDSLTPFESRGFQIYSEKSLIVFFWCIMGITRGDTHHSGVHYWNIILMFISVSQPFYVLTRITEVYTLLNYHPYVHLSLSAILRIDTHHRGV